MLSGTFPKAPLAFCAALLLYAVFGSPTPDHLGWGEVCMALLLAVSVCLTATDAVYARIAVFALVYGASVPVVTAMIYGHETPSVLRDIVPFLCLFMPLFWGATCRAQPRYVLGCVTSVGLIFSLRTLFLYRDILLTPALWGQGAPRDLLYLANSPEVLFSALICLGIGGHFLIQAVHRRIGVLLLCLAVLPLVAMALMMQRAGIGVVVLSALGGFAIALYHTPKRAIFLAVPVALLIGAGWPVVTTIIEDMMSKTALVGSNSRLQEWGAVWQIVSADAGSFLFGKGWGAHLENPAVGGLSVNYTHSLLSSLLLKTGVIGSFVILVGSLVLVLRPVFAKPKDTFSGLVLWAAFCPFVISVLLYASYKSLGFGLILLVFYVFSDRNLEKNNQVMR